ncbi:tyrosine-protein kinase receptor torso isoform X2 [Eupeodes corollae]|uniref:tyrosine-protein kinase receptor torso isoform X2 n=1 Tax=Eupeodes corollae TaxID=290404 RepID=UPI00249069FA|nr:tyrosine-protein kinase receptor torso isoform X2 [Eupeodes corollae]
MLILFAKYTLFMCLAIISDNSNCEKKLYEASTNGGVYWKASCTAKCLSIEKNKNFENCFDSCQSDENSNTNVELKKINESHDLELLCRDDRSITLKVILPHQKNSLHQYHRLAVNSKLYPQKGSSGNNETNNSNNTQEIYIVNISLAHDAKDISVYLSNENMITIGNLSQNTNYSISVAVVYSSEEYSIIAKGRQFKTLGRGYKPKEIQDISLLKFDEDESDEKLVTALISWKPSSDMTCHYGLVCYSPEHLDMEATSIDIRDTEKFFTYNLENLTFSTVYNIGIRAMHTNDSSKESGMKWETITTPSCIEMHNTNFNICDPLKPEELSVTEHFLLPNVFSLNISWQHPIYKPDYYTLRLLDLDQLRTHSVKKYDYNVSKDETWYFIPNIKLNGLLFEIHLTACTPGGNATAVLTQTTNKPHLVSVSPDRNYILKLGTAIFAPLFCIAILSLTAFIVCHRRAKLKRFQERCKYFEELEKKAPIDPKSTFEFPTKTLILPQSQDDTHQFQLDLEEKLFFNDDMEVNRSDVKLYEVLGEGAFGLVRRGIYHKSKQNVGDGVGSNGVNGSDGGDGNTREVAVKMLKDQPSVDDVRAFKREIEVMKSVGRHPNIVGIIGHYTRKCNEMLLLTEYCSFGNLLFFLRNEWKYLHELSFCTMKDPAPTFNWSQKHHHQHQNKQYSIRESATASAKKTQKHHHTENEFNFDSTIVEQIKQKYKNFNSVSSNASTAYARSPANETTAMLSQFAPPPPAPPPLPPPSTLPKPPPPPPLPPSATAAVNGVKLNIYRNQIKPSAQRMAKFNKSYGYEDICTNACKCHVDILAPSPSTTNATKSLLMGNIGKGESALCGQIKISPKCNCRLKRNGVLSVDNEGYYKNLTTTQTSTTVGRDRDRDKEKPSSKLSTSPENKNAESPIEAKREPLRTTDLLEIAKQVAMGMEFLSKNKIVHRDLAARNVLVSSDRTVKIADFGLSRDVYQENVYKKTGNGKLPIKWLALESMTHQVYTSQSDVWSFGILLYEIITLGGIPYPSIPTNRLVHLLKTGYRMESPKNCSQGLYNLMTACWNANPAERPNFTEIINILDNLLIESPQLPIEKLTSTPNEKNSSETLSSDESYLKPL